MQRASCLLAVLSSSSPRGRRGHGDGDVGPPGHRRRRRRIKLRYTLSRGDQVVGRDEERVSSMNFLTSAAGRYGRGDRLRDEKAMLDDWFDARFGKR